MVLIALGQWCLNTALAWSFPIPQNNGTTADASNKNQQACFKLQATFLLGDSKL